MIYRPNLILPDPFDPYPPNQIVSPTRSIIRGSRHYWPGKCTCCGGEVPWGDDGCEVFVPASKPTTIDLTISGLIDSGCTGCDGLNNTWEDMPIWPIGCEGEGGDFTCSCSYSPVYPNPVLTVTFSTDPPNTTRTILVAYNHAGLGTCFPNCSATGYKKVVKFRIVETSAIGPWPGSGTRTLPYYSLAVCGCDGTGSEAVVTW